MELKALIGKHKLSAVDIGNMQIKERYGAGFEDASCISFTLDGITYTAIEDPEDGYRSSMGTLNECNHVLQNQFPAIEVIGRMREKGEYGQVDEVLELVSSENGQIVLEVGTTNTDDYYPSFLAWWKPELMPKNIDN